MTTPHTSDLQTGLTPQNHNSHVVVFCVLQSASPHRCSKRRAAPHAPWRPTASPVSSRIVWPSFWADLEDFMMKVCHHKNIKKHEYQNTYRICMNMIEYVWIRMLIFVLWKFLFFWRPWSEFWSFTVLSLYPETGNSSLPVLLAPAGASATLTDP